MGVRSEMACIAGWAAAATTGKSPCHGQHAAARSSWLAALPPPPHLSPPARRRPAAGHRRGGAGRLACALLLSRGFHAARCGGPLLRGGRLQVRAGKLGVLRTAGAVGSLAQAWCRSAALPVRYIECCLPSFPLHCLLQCIRPPSCLSLAGTTWTSCLGRMPLPWTGTRSTSTAGTRLRSTTCPMQPRRSAWTSSQRCGWAGRAGARAALVAAQAGLPSIPG